MSLHENFFVSTQIHERSVLLPDGESHAVHFRELTALEFKRWHDQENSEDPEVRHLAMAHLLVAGVCDPDGKPALTIAQAKKLKGAAMTALVEALLDINGVSAKAKEKQGND